MDIVTTHQLTKHYGRRVVLDNLNLRIPKGCVYGFLGPNGSGKSTTMKLLLSLVRPTSGEVEIMGQPMTRQSRRRLLGTIGSLIEAPPGYAHLTGAENMRIVQRSLGLDSVQIDRAVHTVRMGSQMDKLVRNYSLGMKQRLGIAMALAREPRLLILDEPTNGLDPSGIEEIRALLRMLADRGVSVIVSSHLLGEIDKTADYLGILSSGKLMFQGTRTELFSASTPDVLIDTDDARAAESLLPRSLPTRVDGRELRISDIDESTTAGVVRQLVAAGAPIYGVRRQDQSLEDIFMDITAGGQL